MVMEMLYEWLSGLHHSVFFAQHSMIASLLAGQRAVMPVINYDWLCN
jgi:hypothetical protein